MTKHSNMVVRWIAALFLAAGASVASASDNDSKSDKASLAAFAALDAMAGKWATFSERKESVEFGQSWNLSWNAAHTHLDYVVETIIKNNIAFKGTGFLLFDLETDTYRIYLMMSNGALHESVGRMTGGDSYDFIVTTYGVPNAVFPNQKFEVKITPDEIAGQYSVINADGSLDSANVVPLLLRRRE